jgi:hypothetical protein
MKNLLQNFKSGAMIWVWFLLTIVIWWGIYALVNNDWTTPNTLQVTSWDTLSADSWNKIPSNQNALTWSVSSLSTQVSQSINSLLVQVSSLSWSVSSLSTQINNLTWSVNSLSTQVSNLDWNVSSLSTQVSSLNWQLTPTAAWQIVLRWKYWKHPGNSGTWVEASEYCITLWNKRRLPTVQELYSEVYGSKIQFNNLLTAASQSTLTSSRYWTGNSHRSSFNRAMVVLMSNGNIGDGDITSSASMLCVYD